MWVGELTQSNEIRVRLYKGSNKAVIASLLHKNREDRGDNRGQGGGQCHLCIDPRTKGQEWRFLDQGVNQERETRRKGETVLLCMDFRVKGSLIKMINQLQH